MVCAKLRWECTLARRTAVKTLLLLRSAIIYVIFYRFRILFVSSGAFGSHLWLFRAFLGPSGRCGGRGRGLSGVSWASLAFPGVAGASWALLGSPWLSLALLGFLGLSWVLFLTFSREQFLGRSKTNVLDKTLRKTRFGDPGPFWELFWVSFSTFPRPLAGTPILGYVFWIFAGTFFRSI